MSSRHDTQDEPEAWGGTHGLPSTVPKRQDQFIQDVKITISTKDREIDVLQKTAWGVARREDIRRGLMRTL